MRKWPGTIDTSDSMIDDVLLEGDKYPVLFSCVQALTETRRGNIIRYRIDWDQHVSDLFEEGNGEFDRMYRMSHASFMKLVHMLEPRLHPSFIRENSIRVEVKLHCLIRWLCGGMYLDVRLLVNVATTTFYAYSYLTMKTIMETKELAYSFPRDLEKIYIAASQFSSCSYKNLLMGVFLVLMGTSFIQKLQQEEKLVMLHLISLGIINYMVLMLRHHVTTSLGLCM